MNILAIFLGGGLGAVLRYIVTNCSNKLFGVPHFGTFAVNITGCFFIGFIFSFTLNKITLSEEIKLFLTVGFLGGLTTFSTFNNEIYCLLKEGNLTHGLFYMVTSCAIGLIFTYAGYHLGKI